VLLVGLTPTLLLLAMVVFHWGRPVAFFEFPLSARLKKKTAQNA